MFKNSEVLYGLYIQVAVDIDDSEQTKERLLYPRTITNRTTIMCDRAIDT